MQIVFANALFFIFEMCCFFQEKISPEFVCISLDLEDISLLIIDMYCDDVYLALLAITVFIGVPL